MDWAAIGDDDLLRAIAAQNAEALGELYDRFVRLVYSLAWNITGDEAAAEEITQDVFVQVWRKAHTYQSERGRVSTWLTSMARNRAIDNLRYHSVRVSARQVAWDEGVHSNLADDMHVEEHIEARHEKHQLQQAISQLPEEQKYALALAYFQGYTHQQIADATGQPLGTVKTRIRLAMQKLREMLVTK